MNRTAIVVLGLGIIVVCLTALFPPWYYEREGWGMAGSVKMTERTRALVFTGPADSRNRSWKIAQGQLLFEVCVVAAAMAFLAWLLGSFRLKAAQKLILWPQLALGVYVASLFLPAIQWVDTWAFGYGAVLLAFHGIGFFWQNGGERLGWAALPACVLGALTNVLMLLGYFGVLARLPNFSRSVTSTAALLAVGVILLLKFRGILGGLSSGYVFWVAAAVILASAAWFLPFSPVLSSECQAIPRD